MTSPLAPLALCAMCLLGIVACSPPAEVADTPRTVTLPALCDGSIYTLEVTPHLHTIQEQSNILFALDESIYIVESGANAISRHDTNTGRLTSTLIDVGNDRNPYDVFVFGPTQQAFVTNYLSGSVTVADTISGEVVAEFGQDRLTSPSGVAATATHVYVSDVEFGRGDNGFGSGSIHIFEQGTWEWVGEITPQRQNPHYISVVPDMPDTLLITNVGAVGFKEGRYRQVSEGAMERWELTDDPLAPTITTALVPVQEDPSRDGAPGRPMFSSNQGHAHVVSATAPIFMTLDVKTMQWVKGPDEPVTLYESDQDTLHAGDVWPNGLALILSYNQDALYLYDTTCARMIAGPVDLGTSAQDLEGPLSVVVHDERDAYFITSLSKRLGKISLRPQ